MNNVILAKRPEERAAATQAAAGFRSYGVSY